MSLRKIVYWLSLVFIFMLAWEGVIRLPAGLGTAAKLVGLVVGGLWLGTVVVAGRLRRPASFLAVTSMFVLWNALSILWSAAPGQSIGHVATMTQCLGFGFIVWDLYRTRAAVLAGLQAYILGVYVAVGGAIVNYLSSNPFYTNYERYSPGLTNPDGFGFIVALGIPVAWYLAGPASDAQPRLLRVVNYAFIPAAFVGLTMAGTRMAATAAIPGMVFGLATLTRLRLPARIAVLALLATAVYLLFPTLEPLRSFERLGTTRTEATQGNWNGRTDNWREGLASFAERPILGVGSNMYRSVNSLGKVAHNSYLSILVELGLIGFILFGAVLTIVVVHAILQPKWDRRFWLTLLVVWAIGASTLTWEDRKTTWLIMSLVVASAAVQARSRHASLTRRPNETSGGLLRGRWPGQDGSPYPRDGHPVI